MHRLVSWSLQFRFLVLIGAAAIAFFGMTQLRKQNVDILPEFAPLTVEVQAEALGLAPTEVESLITAPLEEILSGVPWLKSMQSRSIAGLSAISLHFEDGTSLLKARQMVQERLLHTSVLPKVAKPPAMLQPKSDLNRAMQIGLSSDKLSLTDVSLLARWKIKPRLMSVPGVGPITALTFKSSIEDPGRFARGQDAGAFAGLAPRRSQSGERDHKGRISKAGDPMLRQALYEAANNLLVRVKRPCALQTWGKQLALAKGPKRARVAVARKLAVLLHRL